MTKFDELVRVIEHIYPHRERFDEGVILNNKYLENLSLICEKELVELSVWHQRLKRLKKLIPNYEVIDDTLFEANEPSFQAYLLNSKGNLRIHFCVSVIAPYFFPFIQSGDTEDANMKIDIIVEWLKCEFPDYSLLSEKDCRQEINWLVVPSNNEETTTIADCIFGPRSLKGY